MFATMYTTFSVRILYPGLTVMSRSKLFEHIYSEAIYIFSDKFLQKLSENMNNIREYKT